MYDGHRADFPEVTKELIMAGLIDVNEDLENFCDVLCMAIEIAIEQPKVGSEFVEWLLAHGANPNSTHSDAGDENSLSIAAGAGRKDLVQLLFRYGARLPGNAMMSAAAENGEFEMLRFLVEEHRLDIDEMYVCRYN